MPTVVREGSIRVRVHSEENEPHHLPHCHVDWPNGRASISLPRLILLDGTELTRQARRVVEDNMEAIKHAWNELNPGRPLR